MLLLTVAGLGPVVLASGCNKPSATSPEKVAATYAGEDRAGIETALESLRQGTDVKSCRTALKQLNAYLLRQPEHRPAALSDSVRASLANDFGLDGPELAEVASTSFTLLDANHLDTSFLLRDACQALEIDELPPLEKARAAFNWTIRQVGLEDRFDAPLPPQFALRRSRGTPLDRMFVFLSLLPQLGLDGCIVTRPQPGAEKIRQRPWAVGVLIGDEIYLFDARLGMPIPGPGARGIVSLAALRANPDLLVPLKIDNSHQYDVTTSDLQQSEVQVAVPLSAMAPRMSYLEALLPQGLKASVARDPEKLLDRFRKATANQGIKVRAWKANEARSPTSLLRLFLPPSEGGVDNGQQFARYERELVPWLFLPPEIQRRPADIEPGRTLKTYFGQQFIALLTAPKMPRDHMLRGHYEEASANLVTVREEVAQQKQLLRDRNDIADEFAAWYGAAEQAYADVARASRTPGDASAQGQARARLREVWKKGQAFLPTLMAGSAADALSALLTYFLALTKHEEAERLQVRVEKQSGAASADTMESARQAWKSAADWWDTYLTENPLAHGAYAARALRARCLEGLGQPEAAAALLREPGANNPNLAEVGRLYRIRQLQQQGPPRR
jgi:hypothetical protein